MKGKILAVDDEQNILMVIRNALTKEGYLVDTVSNPEKVCEMHFNEYDLILLDVMMPGIDGFTLCSTIRGEADCPILFLTAKTSESDIIKGLGSGADDYIMKPFGIGELRARVSAHLRRENREKKHIVSVDKVRFQIQDKRAFYGEKELGLTRSEYNICEYLALHKGQVFSREQIYEAVFGYDRESDNSAVTEHIKNIRAKCLAAGFSPVETVWGIGYRWK